MHVALPHLFSSIVIGALLYAAWMDLITRTIPNGACLLIAAVGLVGRVTNGTTALIWSLAVATALFCVLVGIHSRGAIGGGDVKLLSSTALSLSPTGSLHLITATATAGGVLALVHMVLRLLPRPTPSSPHAPLLMRVGAVERWRIHRHGPLPYGIAIACGGAWVLLSNFGS
jgi:prepilin peptidase CpaA